MQINLDPTRWLVSFAGFVVDWVMTREWKRIALNSIPLLFLFTVAGLVFWGSRLDKHKLAQRYLELGEQEIADWESSWAPDRAAERLAAESKAASLTQAREAAKADGTPANEPLPANTSAADTNAATSNASSGTTETDKPDAQDKSKTELSRFAEVLFRRVQLLEPSERSQFVIAVTMAQRGAIGQARKMLAKIAPDNRPGFPPAHAWIASNMLRQPIDRASEEILFHHVKEAVKWDRVPEQVLLVGGQRLLNRRDTQAAIELFKRAAEANPNNYMVLMQLSKLIDNKLLMEESSKKAETIFRNSVANEPYELAPRLSLIQVLAISDRLDDAQQVIQDGMQQSDAPELKRALSEVYRLRFLKTMKQEGELWTGDLQMLDLALRTDPTNAMVGEEIAKLARLNNASPGEDLIDKLRQFLSEGKATAATHAWIAELYLKREQFKQALPHLEQVITRLPNSAQYLNNLAYIMVDVAPDRLDEALTFAQRAIQVDPRAADYYETLARVYAAQNRRTEAIAALESAIERAPDRSDFHENVAKLYAESGNTAMAEQHYKVIQRIKAYKEQQEAARAAEQPTPEQLTPEQPTPEQPTSEQPDLEPPTSNEPTQPTPAPAQSATSN